MKTREMTGRVLTKEGPGLDLFMTMIPVGLTIRAQEGAFLGEDEAVTKETILTLRMTVLSLELQIVTILTPGQVTRIMLGPAQFTLLALVRPSDVTQGSLQRILTSSNGSRGITTRTCSPTYFRMKNVAQLPATRTM